MHKWYALVRSLQVTWWNCGKVGSLPPSNPEVQLGKVSVNLFTESA